MPNANLFRTLIAELHERFPTYEVLADALADDTPLAAPTELLSFIDQVAVADRIREIVDASAELGSDTDLHFRWGRLRHRLVQANMYISRDVLWIRPYVYPLLSNLHYTEAQQCLYMSATVGDPSDLSRRLGTRPIQPVPVPDVYTEKTAGRRPVAARCTWRPAPAAGTWPWPGRWARPWGRRSGRNSVPTPPPRP